MKKTKVWNKDNVKFNIGDKVVVFRRKDNGHPKKLKDCNVYTIVDINGDDLWIDLAHENIILRYKVHKSYMITIEFIRDELIEIILKEDS